MNFDHVDRSCEHGDRISVTLIEIASILIEFRPKLPVLKLNLDEFRSNWGLLSNFDGL